MLTSERHLKARTSNIASTIRRLKTELYVLKTHLMWKDGSPWGCNTRKGSLPPEILCRQGRLVKLITRDNS